MHVVTQNGHHFLLAETWYNTSSSSRLPVLSEHSANKDCQALISLPHRTPLTPLCGLLTDLAVRLVSVPSPKKFALVHLPYQPEPR
jgi:hypothetical protein